MAEDPDLIIDSQGGAKAGTGALAPYAGSYKLATAGAGFLVLGGTESKDRSRVVMAGEIITKMSVMEVINVIATANWRGELLVSTPDWERRLWFDQAALKGAESSSLDDRLGEVMFRAGLLSREQLESTLASIEPGARIGEAVVAAGHIDSAMLFQTLTKQGAAIFHGALIASEGHYVFRRPADSEEPPQTQLHISIHGLLMEGVQRIDEMALFRERIPSNSMCPVPRADAPPPKKLDDTANHVLTLCDGHRTIGDIARQSGYGEFQTTKAVYHLMQAKQVSLRRGPRFDPTTVVRLVDQFNEVMQDIFFAVATYGGVAQTRETLDAWISGSGYAAYFGEGVDDFGCLDGAAVAAALSGVEDDSPLEALHQSLHELAAFALFSATTTLPRNQELTLARDVNRRLKMIRIV